MEYIEVYVGLFTIIAIVNLLFNKISLPTVLLLVIVGMLLSLIPNFPATPLNPDIILDIFLPLLIYGASADSSWRDVKINFRPILLLSVGHVLFITFLVAWIAHRFIPDIGWPMAIVLGAVVSPPDDIAIIPIAEKVHMPQRIITILKGEAMLNDATALILFRFALAAYAVHEFSALHAVYSFIAVIIGETLYGLLLGHLIGELRLRFCEPKLQMLLSLLTPFLAYLPAERLGGCGVLATVVTGFVIGHKYLERFPPEVRLIGRAQWVTIGFTLQNILFLLVGLDLQSILGRISYIPPQQLLFYSTAIILTVIIGRFIWVYPAAYIPRFLFPSIRKKDPYPPWQYPFIISWAGMRGGISLAAALAIPSLAATTDGYHPRDLLIFLVFSVILVTLLVQGLTLPWILNLLGISRHGHQEDYEEHGMELSAKIKIAHAVLEWLSHYQQMIRDDDRLLSEVKFHIQEYNMFKKQLEEKMNNHDNITDQNETLELRNAISLTTQLIRIEKETLLQLWRDNRISHAVKNKLLHQLDHRAEHLAK